MFAEDVRACCLLKEGVEESFPFGESTLVFKTGGKIFLLLALDETPLKMNVKCDPDEALSLRDEYPGRVLPGYHMNKKHWNTVVIDGSISSALIKKFIDDSYSLVKKRIKR